MADKPIGGTVKSVTIAGYTFFPLFDCNITATVGNLTESIATSGAAIKKITKRIEMRENIIIAASAEDVAILKSIDSRSEDYSLQYTTASGTVWITEGWISIEGYESEELRMTLNFHPRYPDSWQAF